LRIPLCSKIKQIIHNRLHIQPIELSNIKAASQIARHVSSSDSHYHVCYICQFWP